MNFSWVKPFLLKTQAAIVRNAPTLLMALGTTASLSAVIFAARETPAAKEALAEARREKTKKLPFEETPEGDLIRPTEKLTPAETIKIVAKYYGPAAGMELLALFCFWAAHGIDIRRQAVLSGLCATAEQALQEYQRKVKELMGEKAEGEIRNAVAQDQAERLPPATNNFYMDAGVEETFIFKGQRFRNTYNGIKEAENLANHHMIQHMYLSELELMWLLDPERKYLKPDNDSGQVGWNVDELIVLDIHWVPNEHHRPEGVIEVVNKDGLRYQPSPGFSRLL